MPLPATDLIHDNLLDRVGSWESPAFDTSITLRRAGATLAAQVVRLTTPRSAGIAQSESAEQGEASLVIIGATDLDIAKADRFNTADGTLVEVTYVRPITSPHVVAFGMAIDR